MPTDLIFLDEASYRLEQSKISGAAFAELLCKIQPLLWGLFPDRRVRDSVDLSRTTCFRAEPGNIIVVENVRWTEVQLSWSQLRAAFIERGCPVTWAWFLGITPELLERASRFDRTHLDTRVLMRPAQAAPQPPRRASPEWFAEAVYNSFVPASGQPPLGTRGPRSGKRVNTAAAMRKDISEGSLTVDDLKRMPEKELAARYQVSRDTARKARNDVLESIVENRASTNDK